MDTEGYTKLTKTGEHIAGGAYIDPVLMEKPELRDPRSDIYSAGAIMYFLLCGYSPGADAERYLRNTNMKLNDDQIAVVMRTISMDIEKRYSTCNDMIKAIEDSSKK